MMNEITVKRGFCTIMGIGIAGYIEIIQKIDAGILLLLVLMAVDYLTGLFISLVLKRSRKTPRGRCSSAVAFTGLVKKCSMLAFVLIGFLLDNFLHQTFFADAICVAFIVNELISVTENAGIMGIPIPSVISDALELLNKKNHKKVEKK